MQLGKGVRGWLTADSVVYCWDILLGYLCCWFSEKEMFWDMLWLYPSERCWLIGGMLMWEVMLLYVFYRRLTERQRACWPRQTILRFNLF